MSFLTKLKTDFTDGPHGAVEIIVEPTTKDLGSFRVRRALPSVKQRMVGPFIFLDHMGPARFDVDEGIDVRPHPHIGLSTVTYLLEGSIFHRDTLGSAQDIVPGDVNLMTAGSGIAHSERSSPESRMVARQMVGVQSWLALPKQFEETKPAFYHHSGGDLPLLTDTGMQVRLILGSAYGAKSRVMVYSDTIYADVTLLAGAAIPLPKEHVERAIYILEGTLDVAGELFDANRLLVFRPDDNITLRAISNARFVLVGGEPIDGPRHLWWNFVSSSKDRIEQAKKDWLTGRFGVIQNDNTDFIPLPG